MDLETYLSVDLKETVQTISDSFIEASLQSTEADSRNSLSLSF